MFGLGKKNQQNFIHRGQPRNNKEMLAEYQGMLQGDKNRAGNAEPAAIANAKEVEPEAKSGLGNKFHIGIDKWKAPHVLKTNLIQGETDIFYDLNKKIPLLIINILAGVLIVAIGYGLLFFWEIKTNEKQSVLSGEIENQKKEIVQLEDSLKSAAALEKKTKIAAYLIKNHIYWTNFFKYLEDNTLAEISYGNGFTGDTSGNYTFSAMAGSYAAINDQANVFKKNSYTKSVKITSGSLAEKSVADDEEKSVQRTVKFNMDLVVDPKIFNNYDSAVAE